MYVPTTKRGAIHVWSLAGYDQTLHFRKREYKFQRITGYGARRPHYHQRIWTVRVPWIWVRLFKWKDKFKCIFIFKKKLELFFLRIFYRLKQAVYVFRKKGNQMEFEDITNTSRFSTINLNFCLRKSSLKSLSKFWRYCLRVIILSLFIWLNIPFFFTANMMISTTTFFFCISLVVATYGKSYWYFTTYFLKCILSERLSVSF